MKTLMITLAITFNVFFVSAGYATSHSLQFLTYNVWGAPVAGKHVRKRLPIIGRQLKLQDNDIVAIEESFEGCLAPNESKMILEESQYPYYAKGPRSKGLHCVNSGLLLLSKFPIIESDTMVYRRCSASDCFARKGVLYARVLVPGIGELDVYTTHMNAGTSKKAEEVRMEQVPLIIKFIERHSGNRDRPVVFLGDFNATSDSHEITQLKAELELRDTHSEYVSSHQVSKLDRNGYTLDPSRNGNHFGRSDQTPRKIDYIFIRAPRSPTLTMTLERAQIVFDKPSFNQLPLSDHFGMQVRIKFQ